MSSLIARVALRYRVAHRYLTAKDLPLGKTFQSELVRIWHGREVIKVTDLTNAGKRGKTCAEMTVTLTYNFKGDSLAWFDETADNMLNHAGRGYEGVRGYAAYLQHASPSDVAVDIHALKSINVEPYGEIFEFKIKQPNGGSIEVKSSPIDFRVTDRHYMQNPTSPPGKGGFFQDTSYWPRKKKDAMAFYAWMKENHGRARLFMNMDVIRKTWADLGIAYDSH
jgi:hypothetical protein